MPQFQVTGVNIETGEAISRTMRAENEADARQWLSQHKIAVETIELAPPLNLAGDEPSRIPGPHDHGGAITEATAMTIVEELRALRTEQRDLHVMIERTLTRRGPFFRHMRAYVRSSVATGVIIALAFVLIVLFLLSVILSAFTIYSIPV